MSIYFTSFYPLCRNKKGLAAIKEFGFPPFIDGSCRREPDFQNSNPCITGLCRPGFSKKLRKGDLVVYTTNKKGIGTKRLIAILRVIEDPIKGHANAAAWYQSRNMLLPNNLMVEGNQPYSLNQTHQMSTWSKTDKWGKGKAPLSEWDLFYKKRARKSPSVAICQVWDNTIALNGCIKITENELKSIFERIPCTETPPRLTEPEEARFFEWLSRVKKVNISPAIPIIQ